MDPLKQAKKFLDEVSEYPAEEMFLKLGPIVTAQAQAAAQIAIAEQLKRIADILEDVHSDDDGAIRTLELQ